MNFIQFYKPTINRKDMDSVLQTMVDEQIGPGERMKEFENLFLTLVEKESCVSLRSYVDALEIALLTAGAKEGDRIGVSVLSPEIYKEVANRLNLKLVMIDINEETCCMDYSKAADTNCNILLVDEPFGSLPIEDGFLNNNQIIIEDISQSLGSNYDGHKAGSLSNIIVAAFEENNIVSSGGGAIVAVSGEENKKFLKSLKLDFKIMTDLNAALGIIQLKKFCERQKRRQEIYAFYQKALMQTNHKLFGINNADFENTGSGFCVLLNSKPENVLKFANNYKVPVKMSFESCIGKDKRDNFDQFPLGSVYMMRAINFPLYPYLRKDEIDTITKVIAHMP